MVPPEDSPFGRRAATSTFVLIHGAWHGGWCWESVATRLRDLGHTVFCPDLPGHGEDPTPPAKVTMHSYTNSVGAILGSLDEPAVLVGHSLGGAVVSQVCEELPQNVRKAVYVSAFLLRNGESVWRHESAEPAPGAIASVLSTQNLLLDEKERTLDVEPAAIPKGFYNGCSPDDVARAMARWRPEPLAPLLTPLSLTPERFQTVSRAYISCRDDHVIPPLDQERMCRLTPCEVTVSLEAGHSPFLSHPLRLTSLLESVS